MRGSVGETGGWAVRVPAGYRVGGWEVTEPIASGSWGSVYAARWAGPGTPDDGGPDLGVPSDVAVKFLPTGTVTPRQLSHLAEMAEREARFHRRLSHPRLIRSYQALTVNDPAHPDLDGSVVLVMERAERSLGDLLRQHHGDRHMGPLPDGPRLIEEICEGLAHIHAAGWVHGDLKPGNVLIMADGSVRLADFGLAAELDGTHGYLPPAGSSDYVPPERWNESLTERGIAVRASADIWALGVTAHEILTGRLPFPGVTPAARASAAAQYAAADDPMVLSSAIPAGWRPILADCLARTHAERRRHSAQGLLDRIRLLDQTGATTPRVARLRRRGAVVAAGVTGVALLAGTGLALPHLLPGPDRPAQATGTGTPAEYRPDLLRTGVGIPAQYRALIVEAGTICPGQAAVTPALVAAMLKAESNFDPNLSDPGKDEYGIARWTPRVLRWYLPSHRQDRIPQPPFPPEDSIPAVGRFLCFLAPRVASVPGDQPLLIAAAYRTSSGTIVKENGIPAKLRPYTDRVHRHLLEYQVSSTASGSAKPG